MMKGFFVCLFDFVCLFFVFFFFFFFLGGGGGGWGLGGSFWVFFFFNHICLEASVYYRSLTLSSSYLRNR